MSSTVLFECTFLVVLRVLLFLGCRKYLLRNLYFDLQTLSSDSTSDVTPPATPSALQDTTGIELDALPIPATQPNSSSSSSKTSSAASLHSTVARTIFSLMFAECCMMFIVLMLQGVDLFSPRTRQLSWKFSLAFLMAVILVVIPLCISILLAITLRTQSTSEMSTRKYLLAPRVFLSLIPVGLYLFALSKIPLPPALATSDNAFMAYLARLIVLGITILGLLSGFGAVANSWFLIPWLSPPKTEPTEQDVSSAQYSLQSIRNDLHDRRIASERRRSSSQGKSGNWFSRITPNFRGGDSLSQELRGLEALEQQMTRHVEALRARREAALYSRTFRGRIVHTGAFVFGIYCIVRIISSLINLLVPSRRTSSSESQTDLIADLLARLLALFSSSHPDTTAVVSFARQISLVFVGLIILTSVRRVLKGATRALRVTSRNLGASLMMLLLAQLMGIYFLSTIVQLRNLFPTPLTPTPSPTPPLPGIGAGANANNSLDGADANLFSTIPEFEVFGALFDWSFLIAAGASAFVRWGNEKVNGVGDGVVG